MENEISRVKYADKVFNVSLWGNIILAILKGLVGIFFHSTAMVADALHSLSDVLSTIVAVSGLKFAHRPPDEGHHYGHGKAEIIAAKILALILIVTAVGMGWISFKNIMENHLATPGTPAVWAAIISLIIKELMFQYTYKIGKLINSSAVIADAWHHRSDAFSSIAALVGIVGAINGYPILDPLAGLFVAGLILIMGLKVYWNSLKDLMDPAPDKELIAAISTSAQNTKGVRGVHHIKARYNGVSILVDMKICVDCLITVEAGHDIAANCRRVIVAKVDNIEDVLIHVNPCLQKTDNYDCTQCEREKRKIKAVEKEEIN